MIFGKLSNNIQNLSIIFQKLSIMSKIRQFSTFCESNIFNVCFVEKFFSSSKKWFCWYISLFFQKAYSLKSFFHLKVSFIKKFVLSKSLFVWKNFLWSIVVKWSFFMIFFGRNQCRISPLSQICWNFKHRTNIKLVMAIFLSLKRPLQLSQELSV